MWVLIARTDIHIIIIMTLCWWCLTLPKVFLAVELWAWIWTKKVNFVIKFLIESLSWINVFIQNLNIKSKYNKKYCQIENMKSQLCNCIRWKTQSSVWSCRWSWSSRWSWSHSWITTCTRTCITIVRVTARPSLSTSYAWTLASSWARTARTYAILAWQNDISCCTAAAQTGSCERLRDE